ncbi:Cyclic nucleotide-gated cation channel beta-1, partial [Ophiophagus hannah]
MEGPQVRGNPKLQGQLGSPANIAWPTAPQGGTVCESAWDVGKLLSAAGSPASTPVNTSTLNRTQRVTGNQCSSHRRGVTWKYRLQNEDYPVISRHDLDWSFIRRKVGETCPPLLIFKNPPHKLAEGFVVCQGVIVFLAAGPRTSAPPSKEEDRNAQDIPPRAKERGRERRERQEGGREGGRKRLERGREGRRRKKKEERKEGREEGRKGGREEGTEGGRDGGRKGRREGGRRRKKLEKGDEREKEKRKKERREGGREEEESLEGKKKERREMRRRRTEGGERERERERALASFVLQLRRKVRDQQTESPILTLTPLQPEANCSCTIGKCPTRQGGGVKQGTSLESLHSSKRH